MFEDTCDVGFQEGSEVGFWVLSDERVDDGDVAEAHLDHFLDFWNKLQGTVDTHETVEDDFVNFFPALDEYLKDLLVVSG